MRGDMIDGNYVEQVTLWVCATASGFLLMHGNSNPEISFCLATFDEVVTGRTRSSRRELAAYSSRADAQWACNIHNQQVGKGKAMRGFRAKPVRVCFSADFGNGFRKVVAK